MDITVRRAEPKDYLLIGRLLGEILELHRSGRPDIFEEAEGVAGKYSQEQFEKLLKDDKSVIFTAECENKAVGYLICKIIIERENPVLKNIKTLYLDDLCVDKSARHCGVGKELMKAAEEYARENGFYNITLNVWEFNENAREFYQCLGYKTQRREMELVL